MQTKSDTETARVDSEKVLICVSRTFLLKEANGSSLSSYCEE